MTKVADRAFVDTNILLAATDEGRAEHPRALAVFDQWPAQGIAIYASGQILREYLAVATRPQDLNGLGLAQREALLNARAFCDRLSILDETSKVAERLFALLEEVACSGKQVHDASVVATMLTHGVQTLVTTNVRDFQRFAQHIAVVPLV